MQPPHVRVQLSPPYDRRNLDSRLIYIFVKTYVCACISVHICFGIFALLYIVQILFTKVAGWLKGEEM